MSMTLALRRFLRNSLRNTPRKLGNGLISRTWTQQALIASGMVVVLISGTTATAQRREVEHPVRQPVRGVHGAIAAGSEYATEAGMRAYYKGGNAVDSGVTTMFAAAVTEVSHYGFGGEAPILIRTKDGKVYSIAGVGTMPKLANADFFRNRRIGPFEVQEMEPTGLKGIIPGAGILPALVPGMVDAALLALREFGTQSFQDVIAPAIDLADGFPLDDMRANSIAYSAPFFSMWPTSKAHFMPTGRPLRSGEVWRQPNLARTLRAMADAEKKALAGGANRQAAIDAVRDYFYRGEIAKKIDAFSKANNGLIRYEDMAAFKLQVEEPVSTTYKGYRVYKPGFWTQGPAMLETLNILEGFEDPQPLNSAAYIHRFTEALKLAYADRDTYYGDPKFNQIPADVLLSKEYAAQRRRLITDKASQDFLPGTINGKTGHHPAEETMAKIIEISPALMAHDTTCVDAIDKDGMMFSATPSGAWLPSVIAGDTGIPLSVRAQSFVLIPGHPNELAPGKRPRVTLSPTLVTTADGKPFSVFSTPGGDNQEQALLQVFLAATQYRRNAQDAVENPRFGTRHMVSSFDNHAWNRGDLQLDERISQAVAADLAARGHKVSFFSKYNNGSAPVLIKMLEGGVIEAGADPFYNRSAHAW
jgi:gamma-glutamyltranspeptidase/glutathione hydrolase